MARITIGASMANTNIEALRNVTFWTRTPPTDGPINAPAEYRDVHRPEITPYVSMLSANPPLAMASVCEVAKPATSCAATPAPWNTNDATQTANTVGMGINETGPINRNAMELSITPTIATIT